MSTVTWELAPILYFHKGGSISPRLEASREERVSFWWRCVPVSRLHSAWGKTPFFPSHLGQMSHAPSAVVNELVMPAQVLFDLGHPRVT
jgi:hypothetical protein